MRPVREPFHPRRQVQRPHPLSASWRANGAWISGSSVAVEMASRDRPLGPIAESCRSRCHRRIRPQQTAWHHAYTAICPPPLPSRRRPLIRSCVVPAPTPSWSPLVRESTMEVFVSGESSGPMARSPGGGIGNGFLIFAEGRQSSPLTPDRMRSPLSLAHPTEVT